MTDNDLGWHTRGHGGTRGSRGAPGGTRGHQGAPGGSWLPLTPKRVIKQQNNDPKPWFKVPKVCPDPKGMIFTHLWGIWGHLCALKQRYLVKSRYCQKPHFRQKKISRLRRWNDTTFGPFQIFPKLKTCWITWEKWEKRQLFSKIWLRKRLKWNVIFSENEIFFFKKWWKIQKNPKNYFFFHKSRC